MRGLLYIALLLMITGCKLSHSQHPKILDEAGNLMSSDPVAALSKLNNMDVSEFQDSATMARWALLYSEAMAVNRLSAPTDTIVDIAIDYYGRHNLSDELQEALRLKTLIKASGSSDALATALYLQKEKEFMLYKERAIHSQYVFMGIVLMLIAAGVIVWMRQRIKLQSVQNEALMAEASCLKCQIDAGQTDIDNLESKLRNLLETRFTLIDSLCQTYYESHGTKTERKAIADKVKAEIDSVRTDSFSEMESPVNSCRDNILMKVKHEYEDMKPDDYRLLVYLFCGLSTRTICLLLDESAEVIYKRKSRLKSRLKERVASSVPDILAVF